MAYDPQGVESNGSKVPATDAAEGDPSTVELREPTGLQLGSFDLFQVRQRIYTAEIGPRNEFRIGGGSWTPLGQHPAFAEVLWLVGADDIAPGGAKRVSRFGGWSGAGAAQPSPGAPSPTRAPAAPRAVQGPTDPQASPKGDAPKPGSFFSRIFGR